MQFSQFLAIAGLAAVASAAAMPAPAAAPAAAPDAAPNADPWFLSGLLHEVAHCSEGDWPCDN